MELAGYPPVHSCQFCQQFVIELNGDAVTVSKHHPIDGLKDERVREALRRRRFDQAPEVLDQLRAFHIFDHSAADIESAPLACPLADMFRKSVPVAPEVPAADQDAEPGQNVEPSPYPPMYPPEQSIFIARGALLEDGLGIGALEIREGQFVGPDMKETTMVEYSSVANFDVVKVPGNPVDEKLLGLSPVNNDPGAAFAHQLARSWLNICLESHESCPKPSKTWMPTRLLKISRASSTNGLHLQLHETEAGTVQPYAALTYCWGGPQPVLTNTGNLQDHLVGIDVDKLPKTLQDALVVTEELGLSYVWVDALCILQDSNADKAVEIANMASVYLNATVVIGACRAKTVHDGFLGPRKPPVLDYSGTKAVMQMRFRQLDGQEVPMVLVPFTTQQFEPIDARAWTYQERLLSLRYLEYGSVQTQWFCSGIGGKETWVDGLNRPTLSKERSNASLMDAHAIMRDPTRSLGNNDHEQQLFGIWEGVIMDHNSRQLSVATDRLPSLAGIAERFAKALKVESNEYMCGVWKGDLARLLMWIHPSRPDRLRPAQYIAPSWSWASMNQPIEFYSYQRWPFAQFDRQVHTSFEFVSCDIKLADGRSPFGAVLSGSLKVKGILTPAVWDRTNPPGESWPIQIGGRSADSSDLWIMMDEESGDMVCHISLLAVRETPSRCVEGLVLLQNDGGRFTRMGTFCYLHSKDNGALAELLWSRDSKAQVVELI